MDEEFLKIWMEGFSEALDEMTPKAQSKFLSHCAKRCADAGILDFHKKLYREAKCDRDEYFRRLVELGEVSSKIVTPGREYLVIYPECYCDIHCSCEVNSKCLCECSRQNLLYILETLMPDADITVKTVGTIISGASECTFRIIFNYAHSQVP